MQEQLERLLAWAKAHPWWTALILGVTVLLGYLAYKRYGGGGGGSGDAFQPAEPSPAADVSAPDGGGDGALSFPIPSTSGSGYTTPVASFPSIPAMAGMNSNPAFEFPVPSTTDAFAGLGLSGSQDIAQYASPTVAQAREATPSIPLAIASGTLPDVTAFHSDKGTAKSTSAKTPSQLVGKGKNFTGWYGNIYYEKGYPSGAPKTFQPVVTPQFTPTSPAAIPGASLNNYVGSLTSYFGGSI